MTPTQIASLSLLCAAWLGAAMWVVIGLRRMRAAGAAISGAQRIAVYLSVIGVVMMTLATGAGLVSTLQYPPPVGGDWGGWLRSLAGLVAAVLGVGVAAWVTGTRDHQAEPDQDSRR